MRLRTACGPATPEEVLSEASEACQVESERRRRAATSMRTAPSNRLSGRMRVGVCTIRMGFMAGARIEAMPAFVMEASEPIAIHPQSNSYYLRLEVDSGLKAL